MGGNRAVYNILPCIFIGLSPFNYSFVMVACSSNILENTKVIEMKLDI